MLSTPKSKGELFLASSLRDGLEDNDIRQVKTLLLSKEADPNVLIPTHGISPFHLVIGNDSEKFAEEVTKLFLRHGGNPNVRSSDGMTPVHVAAAWGRVAVLELLLANGGDPLCLDDDGRSPFHYAFDGNFYNAVTVLGKYCGMSQDEEEEDEPKYKLTLDKILINKGNVVAEYVTSEDSCSVSTKSEWNERFDDVESEAKSRAKRQDFENPSPNASPGANEFSHLNTNNITLRRYQKRRVASPAAANLDAAFEESSVAAERLLIGEIISRLSDTCANDSLIVKDPTATVGNPSINDTTQNAPEIKKMRSFLPPPKYRSDKANFKEKTPHGLVDSSTVSKSPNLRITENAKWKDWKGNATPPLRSARPEVRMKGANSTPRYRGEGAKSVETPPRKIVDRSIMSKSPNLRITKDGKTTPLNRKLVASPAYTCKSRYWIGGNATPPLRSARIKGTNSTPRYRSENAKSIETPPRRLVDTSIISKSPNLRITEDRKSPAPSRRKVIASPSYTCRSRYWNGGNATPPLRSARPEARVKSASSTPKRKHNGSRLHKIPELTRKAERPIGVSSRRAEEVTPTMLDRTYSKDRFGVLTYSPDAEVHAGGVDRKYLARSIAINLDDRMYDDNREIEGHDDSPSDSTGVEGSSNDATRRLKPPRIYNNIKAASEAGKPKGCNVASSTFKTATPRDPPHKKKVNNILISSPSPISVSSSLGKHNLNCASSKFQTASPHDPLGNEKVNNAPVSRLLTPKARGVEFSPKSKTNFRADAGAPSKFKTAAPHDPLGNDKVNNAPVSRLLTPKTRGVDISPKSETNFRAESEKPAAIFDSPGSSRAISVSSINGKQYCDGDDKEETQRWLEVEEACISRCVTPPASVSMIVADDSPSSGHTSQTTFYSDYGSEDSYGSDFNEASVTYSTVLPNTRGMTSISRSESFVSVEEEYTYEDAEEGVVFIERRLCVIPTSARDDLNPVKNEGSLIDRFDDLSIAPSDRTSVSSQSEPLSRSMLDDEILRARLTALGEQPGPITKTTYDVYLKRLWRLERDRKRTTGKPVESPREPRKQIDRVVSSAIPDFLLPTDWTTKLQFYQNLEEQAFKEYASANPTRKYRGGISKTSFCYLLLDPRVTRDLPRNSSQLSVEDRWKRFLEGVFYVGQGKAARPAHHLYDAFGVWSKRKRVDNINRKIRRILDIWEEGQGIVCLHVFYHTMVEEACSREASMIDALDTTHLTNCNRGTYYGYTTTMSAQEKRSLGKYLLYKAMEIFMHEGERQLFPRNVTM